MGQGKGKVAQQVKMPYDGSEFSMKSDKNQEKKKTKMEKVKTTKTDFIKPRLKWKKFFKYLSKGFVSVKDFLVVKNRIILTIESSQGDKIKSAGYILDMEGNIIEEIINEGVYTQKGEIGNIIWKNKDIGDPRRAVLKAVYGIQQEIKVISPEIENPIYSTSGEYIAIVPVYDVDNAFLRVIDAKTGKVLWEYKTNDPGYLTASFCGDDKIAVYTKGKIMLYETISGEKLWEKTLLSKGEYPEGNPPTPSIEFSTTEGGEVIILFNRSIYLPDQHKWKDESHLFVLDSRGNVAWKYRSLSHGTFKVSETGKYVLGYFVKNNWILFDLKTGKKYWETKIPGATEFIAGDKYILVKATKFNKDKYKKKKNVKMTHIFSLLSAKTGKMLPKSIKIETWGDAYYKFINDKLIVLDKSPSIMFFDIKDFIGR